MFSSGCYISKIIWPLLSQSILTLGNNNNIYHSLRKFKTLFIIAEKYHNMFWCVYYINAINNGSACSVLFLSTTGLFPARINILEHETHDGLQPWPYKVKLVTWHVDYIYLSGTCNLLILVKLSSYP